MRIVPLMPSIVAVVAVTVMAVAGWAWLGRAVPLPDVPGGKLDCLSYTAAYEGASPLDADFAPPPSLVKADMARIAKIATCIRTYASYGPQGDAVGFAASAGLKVYVGAWIGDNDADNEKEIGRAIELAEAHPDAVRGIVVGNEVLLRREMTGARLARIIESVKARTELPVTYADIFAFWDRNPDVAVAVDFLMVHVLPYWDDPTPVSVHDVQARVREVVDKARSRFPDRDIRIGEIGWPSAGRTRGLAVPNLINEARFIREFVRQADDIGLPYNIIEAVDQPWKRLPEGTVGGYWGILDFARTPKFPLTGPVSERPDWKWAAGFAALGALVAAAYGRRRTFSGALIAALAGGGGASLLWAFWQQGLTLAQGPLALVWIVYLCVLTVVAAGILARGISGDVIAFRWAVLLPAVLVALGLALDGRHRDFLTLAFVLPAIAAVSAGPLRSAQKTGLAWIGFALAVAAPFAVDHIGNWEALAWAACSLVLAWPLRFAMAEELARLRYALRKRQYGYDASGD